MNDHRTYNVLCYASTPFKFKRGTREEDAIVVSDSSDDVQEIGPPSKRRRVASTGGGGAGNNSSTTTNSDDDIQVTGVAGKSRDYPHPRSMCTKHPFNASLSTSALNYTPTCAQCYCYICDIPVADCKEWRLHCMADHRDLYGRDSHEFGAAVSFSAPLSSSAQLSPPFACLSFPSLSRLTPACLPACVPRGISTMVGNVNVFPSPCRRAPILIMLANVAA